MDRLTSLHRWTGFGLLWLLLGHVVFVVFGYASLSGTGPVDELVTLAETTEGILRAIAAFVLILAVGVVSARFARRRLAYETWHSLSAAPDGKSLRLTAKALGDGSASLRDIKPGTRVRDRTARSPRCISVNRTLCWSPVALGSHRSVRCLRRSAGTSW
jgi:predicted ferric reductase